MMLSRAKKTYALLAFGSLDSKHATLYSLSATSTLTLERYKKRKQKAAFGNLMLRDINA